MNYIYFLAIIFCVLMEAFFSGSEIAIISVSKVELKKRLKKKDKAAVLLNELLKEPEKILATTLVGTNVATVTGATIFTTYIVSYYRDFYPFVKTYPELFTVLSLTPITITFGELIPKSLFQKYADRFAFKIVFPLYFFHKIFRPLTFFITLVAKFISNLAGDDFKGNPFVTKEELELLVESSSRSNFERTERKILRNVLKLKEKTVGDIYVPLVNVVAVNIDSRVDEAVKLFEKTGFSKLPVYKERFDDIIGYILITDLLDIEDKNKEIKEFIRSVLVLPEYMNLIDALKEFRKAKTQLAIVVDEYGSTLGIVTVEDILEEIVGRIDDEFGGYGEKIKREKDGSLIVTGDAEIEDLNKFLKVSLPIDKDYVTVAGFIMKMLGRFPKKREKLNYKNIEFIVEDVGEKRIKKVRMKHK